MKNILKQFGEEMTKTRILKKLVVLFVLMMIVGSVVIATTEKLSPQERRVRTELKAPLQPLKVGNIVTSSDTNAQFLVQKEGNILVFIKLNKGTGRFDYVTKKDMRILTYKDRYTGDSPYFTIQQLRSAASGDSSDKKKALALKILGGGEITSVGGQNNVYSQKSGDLTKIVTVNDDLSSSLLVTTKDGTVTRVLFNVMYKNNGDINTLSIETGLQNMLDDPAKKTDALRLLTDSGFLTPQQMEAIKSKSGDGLQRELQNSLRENIQLIVKEPTFTPLTEADAKIKGWERQVSSGQLSPGEASEKAEQEAVALEALAAERRQQAERSFSEEQKSDLIRLAQQNEEAAKKLRERARTFQWEDHWITTGQDWAKTIAPTTEALQNILSRGSRWAALSNAWLGETEWYQAWFDISNHEFLQKWSNLPSYAVTHWGLGFGWDACKRDDALRAEIPGQSAQFVETPSGTYQFVGSITAERSPEKVAILCKRNPDPEAEEEFICGKKQVCVKDLCYADEEEDGDPDEEQPLKGHFYKIAWGVSAPADESFTPFVDEDKKAVKFNIQLVGEKSVWLYKRADAAGTSVLSLENGKSDRAIITHFSIAEPPFTNACIQYNPDHPIKDRYGETIDFSQCVTIIQSKRGTVEFTKSDRDGSTTTSSPEVEGNEEW